VRICDLAVHTCNTRTHTLACVFGEIDKGRLAAYGAAALLVVAVFLRLHAHGPAPPAVSVAGPGPEEAAVRSAAPASPRELYVDVAGAVRHPGLYRVPAGSRVDVAIQRAGGISSRGDPTGVNLAAPLQDGQQVIVPPRGAVAAAGSSGAAAGGAGGGSSGPISLSQASEAQLETIDGIGPALAGRIIQYRDTHGGFRSLDELRNVSGIGEKRFEALQKALRP
jgi:competence protein ComEA